MVCQPATSQIHGHKKEELRNNTHINKNNVVEKNVVNNKNNKKKCLKMKINRNNCTCFCSESQFVVMVKSGEL